MKVALGVLIAVVVIAGLAGIASYSYNAGLMQGAVDSGKVTVAPGAPGVAGPPYGPYAYGPYWHHRPFGFGFGGFLFPLLFLFLFFFLAKAAFWGGPWRWAHPYGPGGKGPYQSFEEWHRRAHESMDKRDTV